MNERFEPSQSSEKVSADQMKAIEDGLIEKVSEPFGLQRLTRWKVVDDPIKNLEKIRDHK